MEYMNIFIYWFFFASLSKLVMALADITTIIITTSPTLPLSPSPFNYQKVRNGRVVPENQQPTQ